MDLLSNILSHMRLSGTLYFRTSFTSPWSVKVPSYEQVARFHFAHQGRCFVRIEDVADPVKLEQGDLVIITRGASHTLYCDPKTETQALMLDEVVEQSGFTGSGTLVYGETGTDHETQLVCGHFAFDRQANHPLIEALPPFIHIENYGQESGRWMEATLRVIGSEAGRGQLGSDLIAMKMSEIIFAQALRTHLNTAGSDQPVLAGFADRQIARALKAVPRHAFASMDIGRAGGHCRHVAHILCSPVFPGTVNVATGLHHALAHAIGKTRAGIQRCHNHIDRRTGRLSIGGSVWPRVQETQRHRAGGLPTERRNGRRLMTGYRSNW